ATNDRPAGCTVRRAAPPKHPPGRTFAAAERGRPKPLTRYLRVRARRRESHSHECSKQQHCKTSAHGHRPISRVGFLAFDIVPFIAIRDRPRNLYRIPRCNGAAVVEENCLPLGGGSATFNAVVVIKSEPQSERAGVGISCNR